MPTSAGDCPAGQFVKALGLVVLCVTQPESNKVARADTIRPYAVFVMGVVPIKGFDNLILKGAVELTTNQH